jgi:hypothetical protein
MMMLASMEASDVMNQLLWGVGDDEDQLRQGAREVIE